MIYPCVFVHLCETVLTYHKKAYLLHAVLNCCYEKNQLKNLANDTFYVFHIFLRIHAIAL